MNEQRYIKIISFVGLTGSGKSSAAQYLADRGYPKVIMDPDSTDQPVTTEGAIEQIKGIADGGQRKCVIDGPSSWESYKELKKAFPGEVITIGVTATRYIRHQRLAKRIDNPLSGQAVDQHDYMEIEKNNVGGVIAIADFYITNNGSAEQLHVQIDDLMHRTEF